MFLLKLVGKVVAAPFCLMEELRNRLAMFTFSFKDLHKSTYLFQNIIP